MLNPRGPLLMLLHNVVLVQLIMNFVLQARGSILSLQRPDVGS
jgi:hypothetical protein